MNFLLFGLLILLLLILKNEVVIQLISNNDILEYEINEETTLSKFLKLIKLDKT